MTESRCLDLNVILNLTHPNKLIKRPKLKNVASYKTKVDTRNGNVIESAYQRLAKCNLTIAILSY